MWGAPKILRKRPVNSLASSNSRSLTARRSDPASSPPSASIVYVTNVPFSRRDYERYGIAWWRSQGYHVHVLDVGPFVIPTRRADWDSVIYRDDTFSLEILDTPQEFRARRALLNCASLIVDLTTAHGHSRYNLPVLRAIAASGAPHLVLSVNAYPGYDLPIGAASEGRARLRLLLQRLKAADPLNSIVARLPFRWFGVKPATAVVCGGRRSRRPISTVTDETVVIDGHHMDFDIFLDRRAENTEGGYAVFIDQGLGAHREFVNNTAFRPIDVDRYYKLLAALFERIEKRTGLEVVIARHPHSVSDVLQHHMPDRKITAGRTAELIEGSSLVVAHNSAALTMAILNGKPLLLIFSKDYIDSSPWNPVCHYPLADALGRQVLYLEDLDRLSDNELFRDLTSGFDAFITDFVTSDRSRTEKLWPLVEHQLRGHGILAPAVCERAGGAPPEIGTSRDDGMNNRSDPVSR